MQVSTRSARLPCKLLSMSISPADKITDTSHDEIPLNSMWLSKERAGGTGSLLIGDGIVVTVCGEELASAFGEFDLSSLLLLFSKTENDAFCNALCSQGTGGIIVFKLKSFQ